MLLKLLQGIKDNPKTTFQGVVCLSLSAAGGGLQDKGYEPWGSITLIVAAVSAAFFLARAKDPDPPSGAP